MLRVDLHVHTIASGEAFNTIYELAEVAHERGIEAIAITDHGPALGYSPAIRYFKNLKRLPREIAGVKILRGCEANIINVDGDLDIPHDVQQGLDIVLAGLHNVEAFPKNEDVEKNTRATVNAIKRNRIHILTHPYSLKFPMNIDEVFTTAHNSGTLLEINLSIALRYAEVHGCIRRVIELAIGHDTKLAVCSDTHVASELGDDSSFRGLSFGIPDRLWLGAIGGYEEVMAYVRTK